MKFFARPSFACFFGLVVTGLASTANVPGEAGSNHLRIDRWTQAGGTPEIDEPTLQRIAEKVGPGHFFVTYAGIDGGGSPQGSAAIKLFAFYSGASPVDGRHPKKQVLFFSDGNHSTVETGTPEALLAAVSLDPIFATTADESVSELTTAILAPALFGDKGRWLSGGDDKIFRPVVVRSAGSVAWNGFYLRGDGGIEELAVAFPSNETGPAVVSHREIHPAGFAPVENKNEFPLEEWTIAGGSTWHPSQRYKMMTTLAALGNPAKQFQLATALLQESGDDAKVEGMKWLRVAAAQGHRDAIDRLRQSGDELMRPDRDRDKVRLSRCCPMPGR